MGDALVRPPLEAVVRQMAAAVVVAESPGGRVVLENERAVALRRGSPVDGAGGDQWLGVRPDGTSYLPGDWPWARAAAGAVVVGEEVEIRRADGSRALVRIDAVPVRLAGAVVAGVATLEDVTRQREREARWRLVADAGAMLATSLDFATTLRNVARLALPSLADCCAVGMLDEGGRVDWLAVEHVRDDGADLARELARHASDAADAPAGLAEVLDGGRPVLLPHVSDAMLVQIARDPGQLRLLRALAPRSLLVVPLVARGRVLGALALAATEPGRRLRADDLTLAQELAARAALAIDNARLYREAEEANRAKSDFLAVMSHELRTPLTAIIGYTELLELGIPEPITPRQLEQVERVAMAARHLQGLIEDVLSVASPETPARARVRPVRISELLRRAEAIVRPMAADRSLELTLEPLPGDPLLTTDPDRALQVLLSVLSNAVKFTERGGVRVAARERDGRVEVEVRDTGVGMEPAEVERIFDPFWQAEQPATRRVGGTGLGLTIARRLLDQLGGDVRVESAPGRGSTFTVSLPLRSPAAGAQPSGRGST